MIFDLNTNVIFFCDIPDRTKSLENYTVINFLNIQESSTVKASYICDWLTNEFHSKLDWGLYKHYSLEGLKTFRFQGPIEIVGRNIVAEYNKVGTEQDQKDTDFMNGLIKEARVEDVELKDSLLSASNNVEVINNLEGGVVLKKGDKTKDFESLLFKLKKNNQEDTSLLFNSKILTVWHLLKTVNNKGKEVNQFVIGLAKDKEGKLFHWATDLGMDIDDFFESDKPFEVPYQGSSDIDIRTQN